MQLQRKIEHKQQLNLQLLAERELRDKAEKKVELLELKMKKYNEVVAENKRKQKIMQDKLAETSKMREEVELYKEKAKERDAVYNKNKELVTK